MPLQNKVKLFMNDAVTSHSITRWLVFGWRTFCQTKTTSILFSSILGIIAAIIYIALIKVNADLVIYPFIAGFFIVAPLLIIGFQRVAHQISQGQKVIIKDFSIFHSEHNSGIWFAVFILCFCYFIWLTDALVIYGLYFGIEPLEITNKLFTDPKLRQSLILYLIYSGLMGLVTAIIGFLLGVFSIPLMIHQNMDFVPAVHLSIKTVFKHKWLMTKWASVLVAIMTITLVIALPLMVVVFPVLGYASYAVYRDILVLKA